MSEIIAKEQLKLFIERIERLESDKMEVLEDIKQVFDEAKASGFDTKTMKQVVRLRRLDKNKLAEQDAILELYRQVLDV